MSDIHEELQLRVISGSEVGQAVTLNATEEAVVGRDEQGEVVLSDAKLSRRHCTIWCDDGWKLRDLGSSNGTYRNGERIQVATLRDGDLVQLGDSVLEVICGAGAPEAVPEAVPGTEPQSVAHGRRLALFCVVGAAFLSLGLLGSLSFFWLAAPAGPNVAVTNPGAVGGGPIARTGLGEPAVSDSDNGSSAPAVAGDALEPAPADAKDVSEEIVGSPMDRASTPMARETVQPLLDAKDFRRALLRIGGMRSEFAGDELDELDDLEKEVLQLAKERLDDIIQRAQALAREGDASRAATLLAAEFSTVPDSLAPRLAQAHEELAQRAVEDLKRERAESATHNAVADARTVEPGSSNSKSENERKAATPASTLGKLEAEFPEFFGEFRKLRTQCDELIELRARSRKVWDRLGEDVSDLVKKTQDAGAYLDWRPSLRNLFVDVQVEQYKNGDAPRLFQARKERLRGTKLSLFYNFLNADQLQDFHKIDSREHATRMYRKSTRMVLLGECRLTRGNPFAGVVGVTVTVEHETYDAARPNVGVAVFTETEDRLLPSRNPRSIFQRMSIGGPAPRDWVFLGAGHYRAVATHGDGTLREIQAIDGDGPVALPAHLLLAGEHGRALHWDGRECLWVHALEAPLAGQLKLTLNVSNSRSDGMTAEARIEASGRYSARTQKEFAEPKSGQRVGSISILSFTRPVRIASVQISGVVNPEWLDAQLARHANDEFKKLDR